MTPPSFLPPSTPRPITSYIRMGKAEELKRAIIPLAVFVAQGHIDYLTAIDKLMTAFVRGVWSGKRRSTVLRFEERAHTALGEEIERYEARWWNATGTADGSHDGADSAGV